MTVGDQDEAGAGETTRRHARRERLMFADEGELEQYVRQMIREGAVVAEVAEAIGYSPTWVYRFSKRHGIALKAGNRSREVPTAEAQAILADFDLRKDWTLDDIGRQHGVSAERVRQIAERWGRLSRRDERTSEMFSLAEVVREALEGATSLQQVAERTNLSVGQIRRVAETALGINPGEITERNRQQARERELTEQSERLRMAIEMAGLTHRQLAQSLGIQPSRVTNIANGKIPGIETFKDALARSCGVDQAWLTEGINPPAWLRPGMDEETIMAERAGICARLKQAIDSLDGLLTTGQIGAQIGIGGQQLAMMANNRSSPRRHLAVLAELLLVPEQWLRQGSPEPDWGARLLTARQRHA